MHRLGIVVTGALLIASALLACGSRRLPGPAYTSHPTSALVEVPYPPPPARVEYVPPRPSGDAVWIDGEWTWRGRRWAWRAGRWVVPPPNARFAPWTAVRDPLGTVHVAQGTWRDRDGNEVDAPKPLALGQANPGPVVNPEGEEEPAGMLRNREGARRTSNDAGIEDAATANAVDLDATLSDSARMPLP